VKKVHSAPHPFELENLRNVLEVEGISSEVRTPFLGAARGDIPATECWSELWILDDGDLERALAVLRTAAFSGEPVRVPWRCTKCGEEIEAQFGACWQCGSARSDGRLTRA
jgi:Putative prokaryotic signal transducing protein